MLIDGAETTASRLVICESVSLIARIASSTSRRISVSSRRRRGAARAPPGLQQPIHHVAVSGVGGHPPGRHVGMVEQAALLELREFVANRRGAAVELGVGGDHARGHRLTGVQVVLDDLAQDALLAGGEHGLIVGGAMAPDRAPALELELGLGVADDLLAGLLGDRVDDRPAVPDLADGAGDDDLLLRGLPSRGTGPRAA